MKLPLGKAWLLDFSQDPYAKLKARLLLLNCLLLFNTFSPDLHELAPWSRRLLFSIISKTFYLSQARKQKSGISVS
jgi:hypothetical protein